MKKFEITEELANAVLSYLGNGPYLEVRDLVAGLQSVKEIKEEVKETKKA